MLLRRALLSTPWRMAFPGVTAFLLGGRNRYRGIGSVSMRGRPLQMPTTTRLLINANARLQPWTLRTSVPQRTMVNYLGTPKSFFSIGKAVARGLMAVGGTLAASLTYYRNKLDDWSREAGEKWDEWIEWARENMPDFSSAESEGMHGGARTEESSSATQPLLAEAAIASETVETKSGGPEIAAMTGDHAEGGDPFMLLTKRLLEVRQILKQVGGGLGEGNDETLALPALVVIGSQSSGKSSLLEAIVGHEFLPKYVRALHLAALALPLLFRGTNMVTRRPIEITLVHTPDSTEEYADFPRQQLTHIQEFSRVRSIIAELNASVSAEECISDDPIDLRIYSSQVPDLTLIDLPGYIAISNHRQPPQLKQKIVQLCRKYLREPNIILAVCASDVDLANSEALNESRVVDPTGKRTLGVLTKMDLVAPERAVALLQNQDYPLTLGYVGVVCKEPTSILPQKDVVKYQRLLSYEEQYFREHSTQFQAVAEQLGIRLLRRRMMMVLEKHMSESLSSIVRRVRHELEEARYQFKVEFNDRDLTAESYLSQLLDDFKQKLKTMEGDFKRPRVRAEIQEHLDRSAVRICQELFWSDPRLPELLQKRQWSDEDRLYWQQQLNRAQALFTKSGIGRATTMLVVERLRKAVEELVTSDVFQHHPDARQQILTLAEQLANAKLAVAMDQVENTVKPYKYDLEVTPLEWDESLKRAIVVLEREVAWCREQMEELRAQHGRRKLRAAMHYVETLEKRKSAQARSGGAMETAGVLAGKGKKEEEDAGEGDDGAATPMESSRHPFSPKVMQKAREALELHVRMNVVQARLAMLRPTWFFASPCAAKYALKEETAELTGGSSGGSVSSGGSEAPSNPLVPIVSTRPLCPEPFLALLSDKMGATAALFIHLELLNEFFYLFPRDMERYLRSGRTAEELQAFAGQNESVRRHLEVQRRKEMLEEAMRILVQLQHRQQEQSEKERR